MADARSPDRRIRALRKKIDLADRRLLTALAARMRAASAIGAIKVEAGLPLQQSARWAELMKDRLGLAASLDLRRPFINSLYELIHAEALRLQEGLLKKKTRRTREDT